MDLCPYGLPGPLFTHGQALQCMKWTFSSPELPELINPLLRPGQARLSGKLDPLGCAFHKPRFAWRLVYLYRKNLSSSIYLCFGIGGGRSLRKREGIKFPKFPCCHQLPGTCHGRKPTQSCWRCLVFSWAENALIQFSPPSLPCGKVVLYKAAAIGSHKLLDVTGHRVGVQLSPCPPSSRRLAPLSEESTRFSSRNCLIYVILLPKPLQNNVLNAISL